MCMYACNVSLLKITIYVYCKKEKLSQIQIAAHTTIPRKVLADRHTHTYICTAAEHFGQTVFPYTRTHTIAYGYMTADTLALTVLGAW